MGTSGAASCLNMAVPGPLQAELGLVVVVPNGPSSGWQATRWLWLALGFMPGLRGRRGKWEEEEERLSVILVPSVPAFLAVGEEGAGEQRAILIHGNLSKGRH